MPRADYLLTTMISLAYQFGGVDRQICRHRIARTHNVPCRTDQRLGQTNDQFATLTSTSYHVCVRNEPGRVLGYRQHQPLYTKGDIT